MKKLIFALMLLSSTAHAAGTGFMCTTEASANAIAEVSAKDYEASEKVAQPFIDDGTCFFLPSDVEVDITYRGKIFPGGEHWIQVVGFKPGTDDTMFYGLMPVEDPKKGSI